MITTPKILASKYRYIDFLGEGANGKTWLARTLLGDERVAIKALKLSQIENLKSLDLFKREAEILSSISVHGVPKFYQTIMDTDDTGECYLIQQYIDAPSIQSYLDNGRKFSEPEALQLMRKIADILKQLEVFYKPPIIHRDIKPSNILCTMPENSVNALLDLDPWLIDFGAVANPQKKQQGSTVAGTIGYMAPEQILGDNTIQADYYALGASILHMLTGIPPYQIPSELFVLQFKPVLNQHAPDTSPYMTELLEYLLQKAPEQRPQDVDALIQAIENVMRSTPPQGIEEVQAPPTFRMRIKKRFEQLKQAFHTSALSAYTKGYITSVRNFYPKQGDDWTGTLVAEFTYNINDDYFTNISLLFQSQYDLRNLRFPIECTVCYDPDNFAISQLDYKSIQNIIDSATSKSLNADDSQNIPHELFELEKFSSDPDMQTPPEFRNEYTYLCHFNMNGVVALDHQSQTQVNILTFNFSPEKQSYLNLFHDRLSCLSHPVNGLPKLYKSINGDSDHNNCVNKIYVVRELIRTPTIHKYIQNHITFNENQVLFCLLKIARVLKELQSFTPNAFIGAIMPQYIHIALSDLLECDPDAKLWLTAFYISSDYHMDNMDMSAILYDMNTCFMFGYVQPTEQICDYACPQSDYFALGQTAFMMLTQTTLINTYDNELGYNIEPVIRDKAPHTSAPMITLLKKLLTDNAKDRPQNIDLLILYIQNVMRGFFPDYALDPPAKSS